MDYFEYHRFFLPGNEVDHEYAADTILRLYEFVAPTLVLDDELYELLNKPAPINRAGLLSKSGGSLAFLVGMLTSAVYKLEEENGQSFTQWSRAHKIDNLLP